MTVLCADIGTSSLKVAAIDGDGSVRASAREAFRRHTTGHAAGEWLEALRSALRGMAGLEPPDALCISGNGPTLVAESGETLLWNEAAAPLPAGADARSLFIPRILTFRARFPAAWERNALVLSGPEFLIWQLTGRALTILPEKRYESAYWSPMRLQQAGLSPAECAKLPPFAAPGSLAGSLSVALPSVRAGTPVYCGAPDFVSALVGTDTLSPGKLCDRAGSSEGLNLCTERPLAGEGLRILPSVVPGLWNASVLLPESGARFAAFKARAERAEERALSFDQVVARCLAADGSIPLWQEGRALLELTACQVRDGVERLSRAAAEAGQALPERLLMTGGQASNDRWVAFKGAVVGLPVQVPACRDAELVGDAAFALTGMGVFPGIRAAAAHLCRTREPSPAPKIFTFCS